MKNILTHQNRQNRLFQIFKNFIFGLFKIFLSVSHHVRLMSVMGSLRDQFRTGNLTGHFIGHEDKKRTGGVQKRTLPVNFFCFQFNIINVTNRNCRNLDFLKFLKLLELFETPDVKRKP